MPTAVQNSERNEATKFIFYPVSKNYRNRHRVALSLDPFNTTTGSGASARLLVAKNNENINFRRKY